ncbi:UDP-N-acetylmuramate dehydrogenase [Microcoleus sp. FACHB-53]|nr:UDP-N-acetylmuramate dehydrogenase [Microcoleus sp. FACHB-53]
MTLSHDPPRVNSTLTQKKILYNESLLYLPGTDCPLRAQASLASLTSFRVGGPAEWYVAPQRLEDLQASFEWGHSQGLPLTLLGAGSNLLISDRGLPGLVICTRHLRRTQFDEETGTVTAGAGEPIARLAWQAAERGWEGLEWAVGIPGTVGGAVVMNAGAHKNCTADILVNAQTLSPTGVIEELTPQDLGFQYRTSSLQCGDRLVVEATFQLKPGADPVQVRAATSQHLEQRRRSQPYHLPSCGSVFRNPDTRPAAWLIEQLGLKGYTIGGAQVAERHANFILNCGGAQASDIFQIIRHIQQQVEQHWSLWLEPEVKILGEFQPV